MDYHRPKPGPRATSCLTCRQRRKKCDLSRPFCGSCVIGNFNCLGYDDDTISNQDNPVPRLEARPILPAFPKVERSKILPRTRSVQPVPRTTMPSRSYCSPDAFLPFDYSGSSTLGTDPLQLLALTASSPEDHDDQITSKRALGRPLDAVWPQDQSFHISRSPTSTYVAPQLAKCTATTPDLGSLHKILDNICRSIPQTIDASSSTRDGYVTYVLSEYATQRVRKFFYPPPASIRDRLAVGIRESKTTIWVMYLGARLFRALAENPYHTTVQPYVYWIDQLEQQITRASQRDASVDQTRDWLLARLELTFLQFVTGDSCAGYFVFQKCLPSFLHLVSRHPDLCVEHRGNLLVSFTRALSAPWYDIPRFVMYDMAIALVLGVPPLVHYGFVHGNGETGERTSLDWVHGISIELLSSVAQVNAWRSGARDIVNDWRVLEKQTLGWKAGQPTCGEGEDLATEGVARLAVQESWRQTVLIYIYMGMCNASSHDPRVQSSVRQIAELVQIASHSLLEVHTFIHCVIAGLAAKYERQRAIFRAKLLSFQDTRVWLFRGSAFSQVLEHLWHNAGKDGGPVTWDDYVRSRCIVVPV